MDTTQQNFAVMFADVAGSTRLYERLGDRVANKLIGDAIEVVSKLIQKHAGVVVKTIGDEIMCRFSGVDNAMLCACEIHELMENQPVQNGMALVFRIGINWGPAILQNDGDIFGDAVNLAARMAGVAKGRQIITTEFTQKKCTTPDILSKCREIDYIHVKGKAEAISIIEVMWEPNDVTRISTVLNNNHSYTNTLSLSLYYQQKKHVLDAVSDSYSFGRDNQCDQMIASTLASRVHAKIECRRGKFILADESTNGTYLQMNDSTPVFLKREEITLQGKGMISFGEELDPDNPFILRYHFD
jgi:adenylate cyclase